MRLGIFCVIALLLGIDLTSSQTPKTASASPSPRPTLPEFRPALIGTGPDSLTNRIDTADLIKKGQKDAAVMFSCLVAPTGHIVRSGAYRGTKGSELLEQELLRRLANEKFIPAVHNHQLVIAIFYGTVTFAVVNGKPRLRIFANQQLDELKKESDFIDPQPYVGQDSRFSGIHYPETGSTVQVTGVAERRDEFGASEIGYCRIAKTQQRRLLGYELHAFQISLCVHVEREFHDTGHLHRAPRLGIMYAAES